MGTAPYAEDASHVLDISNNSTSHFIGNKVSAKSVTRRFSASKPSPLGTSYTIRALYPLGWGRDQTHGTKIFVARREFRR